MNRSATRLRRRQTGSVAVRRKSRRAHQPWVPQRRRLLLETLEDRRLLAGDMDLANVMPANQATPYEAPLAFSSFRNNHFSIVGEEPDTRQVRVILAATHGHLSLVEVDSINGPVFDFGDGQDDSTFTLRGTIADINLALEWLVFQPDSQYSGTATITLETTDLIPYANLGIQTDSDTVSVTIETADNWTGPPTWNTYPGMLDTRFNDDGTLTISDMHVNRVVETADGQLLVAGEKDNHLAIARLHLDGSLDTTFGNAGIASATLVGNSTAEDVIIQPDGKIVVVGATAIETSDSQLVVARYNADGTLDDSFASSGLYTFDWDNNDTNDHAYAVGLQPNGKIVVTGNSDNPQNILVLQLDSNGQLDPLFNSDGRISLTLNDQAVATDLAVFDDGSIVLGAMILDDSFVLIHVDYPGQVSSTLITDMGAGEVVNDLLIYPDGRILLAGQANDHFALARFNSDGTLDTSFGTAGKVYTTVGATGSQIHRVVLQPDGKLIAVGQASNGVDQDFAVVRYTLDGALDTTFDDDGIRSLAIDGEDVARDIIVLDDLSLLVLGGATGDTTDLVQLMGDVRPGDIQGILFRDHNGNGRQDSGEPGLAGWTVFIDTNHNNQLDNDETSSLTATDDPNTTNADETGRYEFTELSPGYYTIAQIPQQDWLPTTHPQQLKSESFTQENSATENGWVSSNPVPETQTLGHSATSHAGGTSGEARASWKRHAAASASYYADTNFSRPTTADDHWNASGKIEIQNPTGSLGDGGFLGFFNSAMDGPGGESQNITVAGFSFDEGNWSLSLWQTLLGYQSGLQRLDSPTTPITADTSLDFSFHYDPHGGDHGMGLLTGSLGGQEQQIHLTPANRAALQGSTFDAFGLYRPAVNDGNYDQPGIDLYVDELEYQYYSMVEVAANETTSDIDLGNQELNQGPQWQLPGAQVAAEETEFVIQGLSVTDPDAADNPIHVILSVGHGTLTLSQTTGLTVHNGDGNADPQITMTGSLAMINAALNGMKYRGEQNFVGTESLALYANDLGNDGDTGPLTDTKVLPITVTNVNDPPVAVDDEYQVQENQQLDVAAPGVIANDHDIEGDTLQVIMISEPAHGSLILNANGSVAYIPDFNFNQTDSFTYQLNDGTDVSNIATVKVMVKTQFVWHNSVNPYDVNGDGSVTPQDVLQIINTLNQDGSRLLTTDRPLPLVSPFYDVNRDGFVTPSDVLIIINHLNEKLKPSRKLNRAREKELSPQLTTRSLRPSTP
ncbi:MAG: Ig-like domain-containing protein [Pirellulaceae bacterium]